MLSGIPAVLSPLNCGKSLINPVPDLARRFLASWVLHSLMVSGRISQAGQSVVHFSHASIVTSITASLHSREIFVVNPLYSFRRMMIYWEGRPRVSRDSRTVYDCHRVFWSMMGRHNESSYSRGTLFSFVTMYIGRLCRILPEIPFFSWLSFVDRFAGPAPNDSEE